MIKMPKVLGVGLVLSTLFASGCVTFPTQQAQSIWPTSNAIKSYWYRPEMLSSADEAMGILRNLQESFVEQAAGQSFKTFDLDKYGLRTKWEWTETTQSTQYVPSTGGGLVGGTYVSYYGGSYQPRTSTSQYEGAFVIPFAEVSKLQICYYLNESRSYKWGLMVHLDNKSIISLRVSDEKTVKQLVNAIATLSREQGRIVKPPRNNLAVLPLTQKQSAELALQPGTGLLNYGASEGSPAEKAGFRFLDVILEIDGQPVKDRDELVALCENKKSVNIKILRREKVTDAAGNTSLQKTELILPLNLEE
jgi:hypothetical protein